MVPFPCTFVLDRTPLPTDIKSNLVSFLTSFQLTESHWAWAPFLFYKVVLRYLECDFLLPLNVSAIAGDSKLSDGDTWTLATVLGVLGPRGKQRIEKPPNRLQEGLKRNMG